MRPDSAASVSQGLLSQPLFLSECCHCRSRLQISTQVQANKGGKKLDVKKQGLSGVKNDVVRANLMGISEKMNKKGWTDAQGRKGKVCSVTAHGRRYGTNGSWVLESSVTCRALACTDTPTSTALT